MNWNRTPSRNGKGSTYERDGWVVQHCGHPSALWPYAVIDPEGALHTSHNGLGFKTVAVAIAAAEALMLARPRPIHTAAGELVGFVVVPAPKLYADGSP